MMLNIDWSVVAICITVLAGVWRIGGKLGAIVSQLNTLTQAFDHFREDTNDRLNSHSGRIRELEKGEG